MRISIITATYNSECNLQRCIDSVFFQSYKNKEHIIIDGGSSDKTIDIIIKNEDKIDKWVSEKDEGIFDAINKGIKLATGDVIGLLHSDDFYANNKVLEIIANAFREKITFKNYNSGNEKILLDYPDCVYSDLVYIKHSNSHYNSFYNKSNHQIKIVRYWRAHNKKFLLTNTGIKNLIEKGWMPPHPTLFIKKEIFYKYGFYRTDLKIASDYEMILRLFYKNSLKLKYIPKVLYYMSVGGVSNKTLKNIIKKSIEDYNSIRFYKISFPLLVLILKNISKLKQFYFFKL